MVSVFLGFLFDEDREQRLIANSNTGVQSAANQYQKGFLLGMPDDMIVYSALSVGAYPKGNKQLRFPPQVCKSKYGEIHYLPFVNLHLIKDNCFRKNLMEELEALIRREEQLTVYVYSLYMPFLLTMKALKKKYGKRVCMCLLVPDLPGKYGILRKWYTLGGLRDRVESKQKMKLAEWADSYVFLTESMKELFPPKPSTVIEGFLPDIMYDYTQKRIYKSILYTGSLNPHYGILDLIDAFSQIDDPEYQLWICGAGGVEEMVKERARMDSRITYYGFLNKREIAGLQTRCDVLINPRTSDGEYTKYSFPSKTMEYLLSGSKVVMHRLGGIPMEYYQWIFEIETEDNTGLRQKLIEACNASDFFQKQSSNQVAWITEKKNHKQIGRKIKSIIKSEEE